MSNNQDFILNNAIEVGGSTKTTIGTFTSETIGYSFSRPLYEDKRFSATLQVSSIHGVAFKPDGTKMYISDAVGSDVYQYSLSTAWDVSTASYDSKSYIANPPTGEKEQIQFSSDGTKMYISSPDLVDAIYEFDLATAWDISTASYNSVSYNSSLPGIRSFSIVSSGTKLFVLDNGTSLVTQHTLSTAWDLSTASYDSKSYDLSSVVTNDNALYVSEDGLVYFVFDKTNETIHKFTMATAYDITTSSYTGFSFTPIENSGFESITFKPDGSKMYVTGNPGDYVYQYDTTEALETADLSTGNYFNKSLLSNTQFDFSNSGEVQAFQLEVTGGVGEGMILENAYYSSKTFTVTPQEPSPNGFFIGANGTKLYVVGVNTDTVYQYTLSTAWDITTASYDSVSLSVSAQDTTPTRLFFKSDGTKMFMTGEAAPSLYSYLLSTPWDLSTATYSENRLLPSMVNPRGFYWKPDGSMVYQVDGGTGDYIREYTLASGTWDTSSLAQTGTFSVTAQDSQPTDVSFNSNGSKMFVAGYTNDGIYEYALSVAWDVTSATYVRTLSVIAQAINPYSFQFSDDGSKLYVLDFSTDTIYQYEGLYTPLFISWPAEVQWSGGVAPDNPAANKTNIYSFITDDSGTTYFGVKSAEDLG